MSERPRYVPPDGNNRTGWVECEQLGKFIFFSEDSPPEVLDQVADALKAMGLPTPG